MFFDHTAHLIEAKRRTQDAERRATLLASLGPTPKPDWIWPFKRRVVGLAHEVEARQAAKEASPTHTWTTV